MVGDIAKVLLGFFLLSALVLGDAYYTDYQACEEAREVHRFPTKQLQGTCYVLVPGHDWVTAKSYRSYLQ